jgi:hypothetical protein
LNISCPLMGLVALHLSHWVRIYGSATCERATIKCPTNSAAAATFKIDHTPRVR